ncbi:MAG: LysR family transcriptional regulator [Lachnospiraceae bacterium]|nr:LysR family transcriptional regulator [Lachnospiraceae bacterium]
MTLNQLKYFCTASRYHSMTKAAEELYVTQPTISLAIRELEQEFKLTLFQRIGNQLYLTGEGEEFYQKAERLLESSDEIYAQFTAIGRRVSPVRIGIPPMLSTIFFPELLNAFNTKYSEIQTELLEYGSVRACNLVQDELLDLALANMEFYKIDKLNSYILSREQVVFCVDKGHPLAREASISLKQLDGGKVILFNTDSVLNQNLKVRFEAQGLSPQLILQSSQIYTILDFLHEKNCGAFFYSSMMPKFPDIVSIPIAPPIPVQIGIVWKKGKYLNSPTRKFLEFTQEYYKP